MPVFSMKSRERLLTCHPDLQRLFNEVIKVVDCTVICGHRTRAEQDKALREGRSLAQWPRSKHNGLPSLAVDVGPYPIDWTDHVRWDAFAVIVKGIAARLNIKVRWGGDFKRLVDKPHWELE